MIDLHCNKRQKQTLGSFVLLTSAQFPVICLRLRGNSDGRVLGGASPKEGKAFLRQKEPPSLSSLAHLTTLPEQEIPGETSSSARFCQQFSSLELK